MTNTARKSLSAALLSAFWMSAGATTLVHYPMENLEKKSYGAGATISDASATGTHPATLAEYVYGTHTYFAPRVEAAAGLPENGVRDGVGGTTLYNGTVLTFTQPNNNVDGNGAALRIEEAADDTSLHLQSFTVEFMWACAVNNRWASPVSRIRVDSSNPPTGTGTDASTCTFYVGKSVGVWKSFCITTVQGGGGLVTKTSNLGDAADIVNGNWHHLALTLDETTRKLTLYVDGAERGSDVLDGPLVYQDGNPWVFGGHGYYGWQAGGSMDEIRISDRALAPSEFLRFAALPDALARYSMNAMSETAFQVGDTFPNRIQGGCPLTVCPAVHPAAEGNYPGKFQFYPPRAFAFSEPFNAVQDGLGGVVETNESALAFTQPTDTSLDGHGATLQVKDAADDATFHLQEFTIEYFWKVKFSQHWAAPLSRTRVDADGKPLGTTGDAGKDAATLTFYLNYSSDTLNCIYTAQGSGGIVTESKVLYTGFKAKFNDDVWHHHAVTLNAYSHRLTYYVDGSVLGSLTLPGPLVYEKGNAWSFGGYGFFGWQAGGSMDEIRITPYERKPEAFLRQSTSVPPKGTLAYFALDGDFKSLVYPEIGPDDATVESIVAPLFASGNLAFVGDCPGGGVKDGSGNIIRPNNRMALAVSNLVDGLILPTSTYRFDRSNGLTFEFFAKATLDEIKKGAWAVLLAWRSAGQGSWPVVFQENGNGLLNLRSDTDKGSATITSTVCPFDGKWHRFACTLQKTQNAYLTEVGFYIDGKWQGGSTIDGVLPDMRQSCFEIGTRANALLIDEIRISNGRLDVSDFMKPLTGVAIILR